MKKSDNTQGNPWHDEEGKFTSPNAGELGLSMDDFLSYKDTITGANLELSDDFLDIFDDFDANEDIELNDDALDIFNESEFDNPIAEIPHLTKAQDIVDNAEKVLTPEYVNAIYDGYNFNNLQYRRKFKKYALTASSNVFIQELSELRYGKNNRAKTIDQATYDKMLDTIKTQGSGDFNNAYQTSTEGYPEKFLLPPSLYNNSIRDRDIADKIRNPDFLDRGCGMLAVWRGMRLGYDFVTRRNYATKQNYDILKESYVNPDYVPVMSGGCVSTTNYFATDMPQSFEGYADGNKNGFISAIVDLNNLRIINQSDALNLQSKISRIINNDSTYKQKIFNKIKQSLIDSGIEDDYTLDKRAEILADDFVSTLADDYGLLCIIAGYDAIWGDNELRNIRQLDFYNLKPMSILKDW